MFFCFLEPPVFEFWPKSRRRKTLRACEATERWFARLKLEAPVQAPHNHYAEPALTRSARLVARQVCDAPSIRSGVRSGWGSSLQRIERTSGYYTRQCGSPRPAVLKQILESVLGNHSSVFCVAEALRCRVLCCPGTSILNVLLDSSRYQLRLLTFPESHELRVRSSLP